MEPIQGRAINLLTYKNPNLKKEDQQFGYVTKNQDYAPLLDDNIDTWEDFTYNNILAAFHDILQKDEVLQASVINDRDGSPSVIVSEDSIDDVTSWWNVQVCRAPLKKGAAAIQQQLGLPESSVTFQLNKGAVLTHNNNGTTGKPDWVIFNRDKDGVTPLVCGENKLSTKWNSDKDKLLTKYKENWIWPFRQVLTYCIATDTRYGCILTPDEAVVIRVYLNGSNPPRRWNVQYKSIPWDDSGNKLTINLGIWALGMMAINSGHRPIAPKPDTLPLNVWWITRTKKGKEAYEHHLSSCIAETRPSNADIRPQPDTIPGVAEAAAASQRPKRTRRG